VTNEEKVFDTVNDCRKFFNEKNHRFITTRLQNHYIRMSGRLLILKMNTESSV